MDQIGEKLKGLLSRNVEKSTLDQELSSAMDAARNLKDKYQWTDEEAEEYRAKHTTPKPLGVVALPERLVTPDVRVLLTVPLYTFEKIVLGEKVGGFWRMTIPSRGLMAVEDDDIHDFWVDTAGRVRVMTRADNQESQRFETLERGVAGEDPIESDLSATYHQEAYYINFRTPEAQHS